MEKMQKYAFRYTDGTYYYDINPRNYKAVTLGTATLANAKQYFFNRPTFNPGEVVPVAVTYREMKPGEKETLKEEIKATVQEAQKEMLAAGLYVSHCSQKYMQPTMEALTYVKELASRIEELLVLIDRMQEEKE